MSKTERDLTSSERDDALDEMFAAEDFESSLGDALDEADQDLELDGDDATESDAIESDAVKSDEVDAELDDVTTEREIIEADREIDDATDPEPDAELDGDELDGDEDVAGPEPLPEIVQATPDTVEADDDDDTEAREVQNPDPGEETEEEFDDQEVSERILEELRRADIDGPVVPYAPQDDTTTARRRPQRNADYDPAPVPIPAKVPRVLARKPRVRKVTRVVRHVDPWSVFKIALLAHLVLYVIVLTASVLLWNVAYSTNTIDNVERFFESFGWNSFEFNGGELYHAGWIAGLFVVIGLTGLAVLAATLFNLITDLVGGVRFTVLEEEVVETRTSPMRRFVVRRTEPEVPAVIRDGSGVMIREVVVDDTGANDRPSR